MKHFVVKSNLYVNEMVNKVNEFLKGEKGDSEFNDGGSSNWVRNIAIGFALGAIMFAAAKTFLPELTEAWKNKVLEWFN